MPGIRIQHPIERSATFTIVDQSRPYRRTTACSAQMVVRGDLVPCGRVHMWKTYHLNLDETGAVIVSTTIWERMASRLRAAGFRLANVVEQPPDQVIRLPRLTLTLRPLVPAEMPHAKPH